MGSKGGCSVFVEGSLLRNRGVHGYVGSRVLRRVGPECLRTRSGFTQELPFKTNPEASGSLPDGGWREGGRGNVIFPAEETVCSKVRLSCYITTTGDEPLLTVSHCSKCSPHSHSFILFGYLQADLALLCFALPCFTDTAFFTNSRFVATLH